MLQYINLFIHRQLLLPLYCWSVLLNEHSTLTLIQIQPEVHMHRMDQFVENFILFSRSSLQPMNKPPNTNNKIR